MPSIQISCSTPDSQIYYTLDNSEPNSSKNLYTSPFEIHSTGNIKAIGVKEGYENSDITSFEITEEMLGLPTPIITFVNEKEPYIRLDNYQVYSDTSQVKLMPYGPDDSKDVWFTNYISISDIKANNGIVLKREDYESLERPIHCANYGGAAPYWDISIVDGNKESQIFFLNILENKYKLLDPVIEVYATAGVTYVTCLNYNWNIPEVKAEYDIKVYSELWLDYITDYPTKYRVNAGAASDNGINFTFYKEGFLDSNTINSGPFEFLD